MTEFSLTALTVPEMGVWQRQTPGQALPQWAEGANCTFISQCSLFFFKINFGHCKTRRWGFCFSFCTDSASLELIPWALPFLVVETTLGSPIRESPAGTSQTAQKCNNLGETTGILWFWLLLFSPALAAWEPRLSCINHHPELGHGQGKILFLEWSRKEDFGYIGEVLGTRFRA